MKYGWALVMVSSRHIGRKFQTCHGHEVRLSNWRIRPACHGSQRVQNCFKWYSMYTDRDCQVKLAGKKIEERWRCDHSPRLNRLNSSTRTNSCKQISSPRWPSGSDSPFLKIPSRFWKHSNPYKFMITCITHDMKMRSKWYSIAGPWFLL